MLYPRGDTFIDLDIEIQHVSDLKDICKKLGKNSNYDSSVNTLLRALREYELSIFDIVRKGGKSEL